MNLALKYSFILLLSCLNCSGKFYFGGRGNFLNLPHEVMILLDCVVLSPVINILQFGCGLIMSYYYLSVYYFGFFEHLMYSKSNCLFVGWFVFLWGETGSVLKLLGI